MGSGRLSDENDGAPHRRPQVGDNNWHAQYGTAVYCGSMKETLDPVR